MVGWMGWWVDGWWHAGRLTFNIWHEHSHVRECVGGYFTIRSVRAHIRACAYCKVARQPFRGSGQPEANREACPSCHSLARGSEPSEWFHCAVGGHQSDAWSGGVLECVPWLREDNKVEGECQEMG